MITKEQAVSEREFHVLRPNKPCEVWRRNGRTQTWKTRPDEFRIPVKFGLYAYDNITDISAKFVHAPSECPLVDVQ